MFHDQVPIFFTGWSMDRILAGGQIKKVSIMAARLSRSFQQ